MRKWLGVLGLVMVGLATFGCDDAPVVGPGACSDVALVQLSATNVDGQRVASAAVGETLRLDATPKNAEGQAVSAVCHSPAVAWRYTPSTCSLLGETAGFNPLLRADAPGLCELRAIVGNVTGELTLRVTP